MVTDIVLFKIINWNGSTAYYAPPSTHLQQVDEMWAIIFCKRALLIIVIDYSLNFKNVHTRSHIKISVQIPQQPTQIANIITTE